jgi:hypothetical protein
VFDFLITLKKKTILTLLIINTIKTTVPDLYQEETVWSVSMMRVEQLSPPWLGPW